MNKLIKLLLISIIFVFKNAQCYAAGAYSLSIHYLDYIDYFDVTGYLFLLLNFILLLFLCIRKPHLLNLLILFLLIRSVLSIINLEFFSLPESAGDAFKFVRIATEMSNNGLYENIVNPHFGTYFKHAYPWILALFFSIFGESYLLAGSMSILIGMLTIYYLDDFLKLLWGNLNFTKVLFFVTLMPSLLLYSVLPLREGIFVFTLLIAFYNAGLFLKFNRKKNLILAFLFFFITGTIHGGGNVGLILFTFYLTFKASKTFFKNLFYLNINIFNSLILVFGFIAVILYLNDIIVFSKIGSFSDTTNADHLSRLAFQRTLGDASYPEFLIPSSSIDLIWIIPLKFFYFLFGPFPWDIKSNVHIIGFFEGLIYIYLVSILLISFKTIKQNDLILLLLLCLIVYILAFSIGTSNFGTGYRHRAKFFIFVVCLVAPFIFKKKLI